MKGICGIWYAFGLDSGTIQPKMPMGLQGKGYAKHCRANHGGGEVDLEGIDTKVCCLTEGFHDVSCKNEGGLFTSMQH